MSKWYKYESPNGTFYSPKTKTKSQVKVFSNINDLEKFANSHSGGYEIINSEIIELYSSVVPAKAQVDIPLGVYTYEPSGSNTPERLEPVELRDDKYIDIMPSLRDVDESVKFFLENRDLYKNSLSMYKLGILLYGSAGTGKSTFIREFVRKHDAIVVYINEIPSNSFLKSLEDDTKDVLKIFVFEEVVASLSNPHEIREMLEFLDGLNTVSNAIYFMSTNYPTDIPENIIRNGRVDVFAKVEYPEDISRSKLIKLYLGREASDIEVESTKNLPIVDIRQVCFLHKKEDKSFADCVKMIEDKNKMVKKHFGKSQDIRLV